MKKIKVLSAFLIIILLINTIMPLISYATERNATISNEIIKTLEEGTTNYDVDTNDKVENGENTTEDSILQEDGKNELNKDSNIGKIEIYNSSEDQKYINLSNKLLAR